eukprot:g4883.t1
MQDCEDPPFFSTHGSNISTTAANVSKKPVKLTEVRERGLPCSSTVINRRPELRRMDDLLERLWDPDSNRSLNNGTRRIQNPYRPSMSQNIDVMNQEFTATWGGELRLRNEALVDENAFAKEQTKRDLERLNAIEQRQLQKIHRDGHERQDGSYIASCSADMRDYALDEDDPRIPSFLRKRDPVPLKRIQVPGMMVERESSIVSSTDDNGFGFIGMDFTTIRDLSSGDYQSGPPSISSCSEFSFTEKGRHPSFKSYLLSKCARRVTSWKRLQKQITKEFPSIREDNEPVLPEAHSDTLNALPMKGRCFLCLGGSQATKYSLEEPGQVPETVMETRDKTQADLKSVLLTTSPLYGDMVPQSATKASPIDNIAFSTQQSLNIAATHNPTNDLSSDEENEDVIAIWDESDVESDHDGDSSSSSSSSFNPSARGCSARLSDCPSARSWEPPVLKTDQEYEMYQLQSRMESFHSTKHHLDCLSTASLSSWDYTSARDLSRLDHQNWSRRPTISGSDFGRDEVLIGGGLGSEDGCCRSNLSFGSKASR